MAVNAVNLDGICVLAVQLSVAVGVLSEMTIQTMHALLQMNVLEVHRHAGSTVLPLLLGPWSHRFLQFHGRDLAHDFAMVVQQVASSIPFDNCAEIPTMSFIVDER